MGAEVATVVLLALLLAERLQARAQAGQWYQSRKRNWRRRGRR